MLRTLIDLLRLLVRDAAVSAEAAGGQDEEDLLGVIQHILAQYDQDERKDSEQYQEIRAIYRKLSAEIHAVRKLVASARLPDSGPSGQIAGGASLRPRLPIPKFTENLGPPGKPGVVSMGEEVAYLQQLLNYLGYQLEETEVYDDPTTRALMDYQKQMGLLITGIVGAETLRLLNELVTG